MLCNDMFRFGKEGIDRQDDGRFVVQLSVQSADTAARNDRTNTGHHLEEGADPTEFSLDSEVFNMA